MWLVLHCAPVLVELFGADWVLIGACNPMVCPASGGVQAYNHPSVNYVPAYMLNVPWCHTGNLIFKPGVCDRAKCEWAGGDRGGGGGTGYAGATPDAGLQAR